MDIRTDYVSKPFFSLDIELDNGNILTLNWNIFEDKKDNNKLVLRVRYVLTDNGERASLKTLNFKLPFKFQQIYVDEKIQDEIENLTENDIADFISDKFGFWLMTDFLEMINSTEISTIK